MKPIAAFAALLVVLHAVPRQQSRQMASQGQGQPKPPVGVEEPLVVLNAERAWSSADAYWVLLQGDTAGAGRERPRERERDPNVRHYALRAIGRAEDPGQVRRLLALTDPPFAPVASAIAQSLYRFDPQNDPRLLADVAAAFVLAVRGPYMSSRVDIMRRAAGMSQAMSHIAYATEEQVSGMEALMRDALGLSTTSVDYFGIYLTLVTAFEALARVNVRLVHFDDDTIEWLEKAAKGETTHGWQSRGRLYAFMALVNARVLTPEIERKALKDTDWTVRRAAAAVLAGGGGGLDDEARVAEIRDALDDNDPHVRYEAVRAWARHAARTNGCQPLVDALKDNDQHVVLLAFDLLGTHCLGDEEITKRIEAETSTALGAGWHRPMHAFVALAKRSQEKSAIQTEAFTTHPVWWVRMYSAFAAAGAKDLLRLDRLAYDENDNVREAAIPHLRSLDAERAERAMLAALERTDIQLIHTIAGLIKQASRSPRYVAPLVSSLDRLTRRRIMTSRDGRLALLDAIEHHARPDDHVQIASLSKDYDPVVAKRAADVISRLSGRPTTAQPVETAHIPTQPFDDLRQCVVVNMSPGRPFRMRMDPGSAPIAVEQFLKLATQDRYYNGLTIHRVVPNFVIQGGSPGANEYAGNKEYWRDEIAASNIRGTVGLSIRGRNTADAQFYVNLVDNPRLDGGYTVFAHVFPDDMDAVDRIQEGDVMRSIDSVPCGDSPRRR